MALIKKVVPLEDKEISEYKIIYSDIIKRFDAKEHDPKNIYPFNMRYELSNQPQKNQDISLTDLYDLLRSELHKQHEETRSVIKEESQQLKKEVVQVVKDNPIATIELMSKIILICSLFSLVVYFLTNFSIINPVFSLLLVASSFSGIVMARIRNRTLSKRN